MEKWQDYFRKVTILLETSHFLQNTMELWKEVVFFGSGTPNKSAASQVPNDRCGGATYLDLGSWCTATFEEGGRVGRSQRSCYLKLGEHGNGDSAKCRRISGKTENMFLRVWGWCVCSCDWTDYELGGLFSILEALNGLRKWAMGWGVLSTSQIYFCNYHVSGQIVIP